MATKVEQSSSVEPGIAQSPISAPASSISPKVSMFGAKKSGFVIPKNKLSGRLVPMFRGGGKVDAGDAAAKEDSSKQVQRKTKWGVDLNQDASVRRGRALAYQASRVTGKTTFPPSGYWKEEGKLNCSFDWSGYQMGNALIWTTTTIRGHFDEWKIRELEYSQEILGT